MVISGVVKSLIINFSPSLVWLPGAGRSACVSSVSSAGNMHYMLCYAAYFFYFLFFFAKLRSWVSLKWSQQLPKCSTSLLYRGSLSTVLNGASLRVLKGKLRSATAGTHGTPQMLHSLCIRSVFFFSSFLPFFFPPDALCSVLESVFAF